MEHTIELNEQNQIEIKFGSNIALDEMNELTKSGQVLAVELKEKGLPVLFLCDGTNLKHVTPEVLSQASKLFSGLLIDKVACFGLSPITTSFGNLMSIFGGFRERFRTFPSREEAVAWLLSNQK